MTFLPGRLYRRLEPTSPLFEVTPVVGTNDPVTDPGIVSLNLRRGDRSGECGFKPATAEVVLEGSPEAVLSPVDDKTLQVRLTDYGAALVAAAVADPAYSAASLYQSRWLGRVERIVLDQRRRRETSFWSTKRGARVSGAAWHAQLPLARKTVSLVSNTARYLGQFMNANSLISSTTGLFDQASLPVSYIQIASALTDRVYFPSSSARTWTYDQVADIYRDAGFYVRPLRNGNSDGMSLTERHAFAVNFLTNAYKRPLRTRQVLAPLSYEQPASAPARVRYKLRDQTTAATIYTVDVQIGAAARSVFLDEVDTTPDVWPRTLNVEYANVGRANRAGGWGFYLPEVTVDMLALLTSDVYGDRLLAGQLLRAEIGDPLALPGPFNGGLFSTAIAGMYYLEEIQETITKDSWTFTLGLLRDKQVTGQAVSLGTVPADPDWP